MATEKRVVGDKEVVMERRKVHVESMQRFVDHVSQMKQFMATLNPTLDSLDVPSMMQEPYEQGLAQIQLFCTQVR